jgi:murein endopeptidase
LRWDLAWAQPLWRPLQVEHARLGAMLRWLADDPRVGRMFLEPHLEARLGVSSTKIRFQGCRAARHDDHLHVELGRR